MVETINSRDLISIIKGLKMKFETRPIQGRQVKTTMTVDGEEYACRYIKYWGALFLGMRIRRSERILRRVWKHCNR